MATIMALRCAAHTRVRCASNRIGAAGLKTAPFGAWLDFLQAHGLEARPRAAAVRG